MYLHGRKIEISIQDISKLLFVERTLYVESKSIVSGTFEEKKLSPERLRANLKKEDVRTNLHIYYTYTLCEMLSKNCYLSIIRQSSSQKEYCNLKDKLETYWKINVYWKNVFLLLKLDIP